MDAEAVAGRPGQVFRVPFQGHTLVGDVLDTGRPPRLLMLHGAGQSHRERFRLIRERFLRDGIGSVAFDCVGHGDTGGDLKATSLRSRTAQASAVIDALAMPQPLAIFGASMGASTAVSLLPRYAIDAVVLVGPAMYAAEADGVPFNAGFTDIIRRPHSWASSHAWGMLARFSGRLLIVAGEHDAVIPPDVIRRIYESAARARERRLLVVPGASHLILTHLRATAPDQLEALLARMAATLA